MTRKPTIILELTCIDCKNKFETVTTRPMFTEKNKKYCDECVLKRIRLNVQKGNKRRRK